MGYTVDTTGMDNETLGGFQIPKDGKYHASILSVVCGTPQKPDTMVVEFSILCGTTPEQQNLTWKEYFAMDKKPGASRAMLLARESGIIDPAAIGGGQITVEFEEMIGRTVIVDGQQEEYDGRDGQKHKSFKAKPTGFYGLMNPKGFDCPADPTVCSLFGVNPSQRVAATLTQAPPATSPSPSKPASKQPAAAAKPSGWDSI